ncbi:MAG: glycosyl transferase [Planctomycetota bacterium]|nr:MAG: glycosyl transferase [Planctomycetota bacterium]
MSQLAGGSSRIAILVPCYNEAATIRKVVEDFQREIPEATVFVFDNNSTDGTAELARAAGAVVIPEKKQGKGHVVAAMLEKIDADYYVMVDGDDTYPADRVRDLLEPVATGRADMVVGIRRAADAGAAYRPFHVFGNRLVVTMVNKIFGARLTDIMSGYRAFNRDIADNLPVCAYGFDIETEMTVQCLYHRWVIHEVPVAYGVRPEGSESKLNTFHDGLRVIFKILSLFRSYKPLTFFGGLAILFFVMGCLCGVWLSAGQWGPDSGYRLAMIVIGATMMAMSLIAASIGVIVQLINFRFLELDSLLRRRRGSSNGGM